MACSLHWEDQGIRRLFSGTVSGDEILQSNLYVQGSEKFDQLHYIVSDFVDVIDLQLTDRDIARIASVDNVAAKSNAHIRIAIVVNQNSLRIWSKMYIEKMQHSPYECKVFEDLHAANTWARELC